MKDNEFIKLGHGGGGRMARRLVNSIVEEYFLPGEGLLLDDSAILSPGTDRIVFTTDSFVVEPLFFPGGDIGKLAVCGTVNDLSVMGAVPLVLSCALIIEEGFRIDDLRRILDSMKITAKEAGVRIVTGDTKVVERGAAKGIFINTSGVGRLDDSVNTGMERIQAGDCIIVTGTIGDHGAAIITARNELELETDLVSDCMPVNGLVASIMETAPGVKFMRDPTRGGLGGTLNEIAEETGLGISVNETKIPVRTEVASICDLLGFDPLYMANEGKVVAVVPAADAEKVVESLKDKSGGVNAAVIGKVTETDKGRVVINTIIGGKRIMAYPEQDQLPRIC